MPLYPPPPRPYNPWTIGYRYDPTSWTPVALSTSTLVANTMYASLVVPISNVPGGAIGLTAIDYRIVTNAAAGKKVRPAIYTMGSDGKPASLIAQGAEGAADPGTNTTVDDAAFVATVYDLVPFFVCIWGDGAPVVASAGGGSGGNRVGISTSVQGGQEFPAWSAASQTYTAGVSSWPSTFPACVASLFAPNLSVKRGS